MTTQKQTASDMSTIQSGQRPLLPLLLIPACIFELLYLLLLALSPLAGLHLSSTPLMAAWPWTLLPSHLLLLALAPVSAIFHSSALLPPALLGIVLIGLSTVYAWTIVIIHHHASKIERGWLLLLLGCTLLFGLTLLFQPMLFSDDVFTYMFSGRILTIYGANPLNTAPFQFPGDPYLPWVISGRDTPNIYGPLWLCISSLLVWVSNSPVVTLLLFKGVALLAHLLNCVLVWSILGKIAPSRRLSGAILYAWNPLALIELIGSGHSEGVLILLLLLAVWLYVQGQGRGLRVSAMIVFGLAVSTNLIVLLLAPLLAWFDVRGERRISQAIWGFCWRTLLIFMPAITFLLPFWRGSSTFFAITSAIDMEHFVHAPVGVLAIPIRAFFQAFAQWAHFPAFLQPLVAADVTLRASATFIFLLIYIRLFGLVHNAPTTDAAMYYHPNRDQEMLVPGLDRLLSSWAVAVFWGLVLASGWFWPWYVLWMLWIVVLRRFDAYTLAILILSGTALLIYPFVGFSRGPLATYQTALIFGIPLICLVVAWSRQKYAERTALSYDR